MVKWIREKTRPERDPEYSLVIAQAHQEAIPLFGPPRNELLTGVSTEHVNQAMKNRPAKPLFLIDASVPRNIEESVAKVDNVYLYNMDDVSAIANGNLKSRMEEVDRCRDSLARRAMRPWRNMKSQPSSPS